ncbi:hypothetical protein BAUCODRAFT_120865 [Baudoinia panamericana UAMH 10762]|uniref:Uncharacterized protein n=1 Tax=Baudoinia panamericana (strain UAMH 10762) TaxID=717646 RepID=M2N1Z3_BAUPA|nr:uncharacterized protein BAUCODRAFT_120865 [Baudoinia panamericana UAMH 10762]EMC97948.1 hypothetical protein BAUCODRAFT_120865 [Baudoinia panamericana UAMH 10762]
MASSFRLGLSYKSEDTVRPADTIEDRSRKIETGPTQYAGILDPPQVVMGIATRSIAPLAAFANGSNADWMGFTMPLLANTLRRLRAGQSKNMRIRLRTATLTYQNVSTKHRPRHGQLCTAARLPQLRENQQPRTEAALDVPRSPAPQHTDDFVFPSGVGHTVKVGRC